MTWGFEHFGQYLLGMMEPFSIETDHKSLMTIARFQPVPSTAATVKVAVGALLLLRIDHVPGKKNSCG